MLNNVFSLVEDFESTNWRFSNDSKYYFQIIDYLLKMVQHIACGFGTISKNEYSDCLEYIIKLTTVEPIVILQYENHIEKDCSVDELHTVSNHGNNYLKIIEDLLMIIQNIVAGIAFISANNVDDNYLEFKIDFPATGLTVILLYELFLQQRDNYKDFKYLDCKTGTRYDDQKVLNTKSIAVNDYFESIHSNSENEIPELISDYCQVSLIEEKCKETLNFNSDVISNIMPVTVRKTTLIDSAFSKKKETELHCSLFSQKMELFGKSKNCEKSEVKVITYTTPVLTNINGNTYLNHDSKKCTYDYQNNEFLENYPTIQKDAFKNDSFSVKEIKENNHENRTGISALPSISQNNKRSDFCFNPSIYSEDQLNASNTDVIDMEIDDGKELPNKFQKIVFDYSKGRKLFKCKYCDKSFDSSWDTNKHEKMHMCSYCDKTFELSSLRSKHEKSHMNENIYYCDYCEKSFASKAGKRQHEKNHKKA